MALSRKPQIIDVHTWYYEQPSGLLIVHEMREADGRHIRTDQFKLPWRKIGASLRRKVQASLRRRADKQEEK